jgi:hypothetical protein
MIFANSILSRRFGRIAPSRPAKNITTKPTTKQQLISYKQIIGQPILQNIQELYQKYTSPLVLPDDLEWSQQEMTPQDVYTLINNHMFSLFYFDLDYIEALFKHASLKNIILGIRDKKTRELIGFVLKTSTRVHFSGSQSTESLGIIEEICLHKKWRKRRLTPLLIDECLRIFFNDPNYNDEICGIFNTTKTPGMKPLFQYNLYSRKLQPCDSMKNHFIPFSMEHAEDAFEFYSHYAKKNWKIYLDFANAQEFYNYFKSNPNITYSIVAYDEGNNKENKKKMTFFANFFLQPKFLYTKGVQSKVALLHTFACAREDPCDDFEQLFLHLGNENYNGFNCYDIMGMSAHTDRLKLISQGKGNNYLYFYNRDTQINNDEWGFTAISNYGFN